jgi:DNA-binding IclR family transcriptional regulator
MPNDTPGRQLKTIETATDIIDIIQKLNGAEINELAQELDLAQSTVYGYVNTLENQGYLTQEDELYYLGLEFLNKGGHTRTRKSEYEFVIKKVNDLVNRTAERAQFIVEENGRGYYIHTATGENAVHVDARVGKKIHLHASSAGKALLAAFSETRVRQILEQWGTPSYTQQTLTGRDDLLAELSSIRERGYSISDQESIEGLRAIGVAIHPDDDKEPVGAISLSGPAHRLKGTWFEQELPDIVRGVVNEIELDLKYQ